MANEYKDKLGVIHFDDPTIEGNEGFLRRIEKLYWHKKELRLSSTAFGPEGISFCLESLIAAEEFHDFFPAQGLFRLRARQLRKEGEVLERDPNGPLKWEKAHARSWGNRNNKTRKKKFSINAEIIYPYPSAKLPLD